MYAVALALQSDGLTFGEVVSDLPHDAGALVVYLVLGLFVFFIWTGSQRRFRTPEGVPPRPDERSTRTSVAVGAPATGIPREVGGEPAAVPPRKTDSLETRPRGRTPSIP